MSRSGREPRLRLRLYIAGPSAYSTRAQNNLAAYAEKMGVAMDLEVVDVRHEPGRAVADSVVVTPTLVKLAPAPRAMVFGDLSDTDRLADALGLLRR